MKQRILFICPAVGTLSLRLRENIPAEEIFVCYPFVGAPGGEIVI